MKVLIRMPELYTAPTTDAPPPLWIRGLLILTCTLVSFFHGSNDGQKGMGLIMLILIGVAPTAYALNRALPESPDAGVRRGVARPPRRSSRRTAPATTIIGDPRPAVTDYVHAHKISEGTYPSLAVLVKQIGDEVQQYGSLAKTPLDKVQNVRNDMYLASEAIAHPRQGQGERAEARRESRRSAPTRSSSTSRPSSSRPGSRSASPSRSASAR